MVYFCKTFFLVCSNWCENCNILLLYVKLIVASSYRRKIKKKFFVQSGTKVLYIEKNLGIFVCSFFTLVTFHMLFIVFYHYFHYH